MIENIFYIFKNQKPKYKCQKYRFWITLAKGVAFREK